MSTVAALTIDRSAITANYQTFRRLAGENVALAGIVKANAYGVGIETVVPILEAENCPIYFVSGWGEAEKVRALTPRPIAVLNGITTMDDAAQAVAKRFIPVLNTPDQMRLIPPGHPVILHIDTGMNRLGFSRAEFDATIEDGGFKNLNIQYIMSHFACADKIGHKMTEAQSQQFVGMAARLDAACGRAIPRSLANSSGLFRSNIYHHHLVRPGMALYGLNPTPEGQNPMRPVVTYDTPVLQVRHVMAGETIGYGATPLDRAGITATVALGYADGFLRQGGHKKACLFWRGCPCPVLGRVSMDLVSIDLSHLPAPIPPPALHDPIEVLGPHQDADALAASIGTIGYEILTQLSTRATRVYK